VIGAGVAVALAVVAARVALDSRAALRAGAAAEARGDRAEAVRLYLDAARAYLPGSPYVRDALDRLETLAGQAEGAGDRDAARRALEAERAALLGARSFYTPHAARLDEADRRLASLYADLEDPAVDPGASREARVAWHTARLSRRPEPALRFVLVAFAGLALWLGAVIGFARGGLDVGLRLRRGPAIAAALAFVVGFALFVTGLRLG
jgi:hypothetical protein